MRKREGYLFIPERCSVLSNHCPLRANKQKCPRPHNITDPFSPLSEHQQPKYSIDINNAIIVLQKFWGIPGFLDIK